MNATSLMLGMVFGSVGLGFLIYGRKAGLILPAVSGLALMVVPYLVSSIALMSIICGVLVIVPFVLRDL